MSAIGINVTDRERVVGWEAVQPKHRSAAEVAYLEARDDSEARWRWFTSMVDSWIAVGNYERMQQEEASCKELEDKANSLHRQMYCKHVNIETAGGWHFSGEPWDDVSEYCVDCGASL